MKVRLDAWELMCNDETEERVSVCDERGGKSMEDLVGESENFRWCGVRMDIRILWAFFKYDCSFEVFVRYNCALWRRYGLYRMRLLV